MEEGSQLPSDANSDSWLQGSSEWSPITDIYPTCPATEREATGATSPALWAARYWETIPLPEPRPYIAPGWGITGWWAYLETGGQTTFTHTTHDTPFGPLEIVATGRYEVDWGDGVTSGPHHSEGRPWPDGEIRHIYTHVGAYDVVVTERWTATWRFGTRSGTLRQLQTTGRIDDFEVRQIQAVVTLLDP
jgi:hypothetical protein